MKPSAHVPSLALETEWKGTIVAGIDEAGRGPLAGPVVAAAVILDAARIPSGINDSKKLTPAQREALSAEIEACAECGLGIASVEEIDRHNILQATFLAMRRAVEALPRLPGHALVDGNRLPPLPCPATAVVEGDAKSLSIAAASIVAKVARDRIMTALAQEFPHYGWHKNAGYGTALHQAALAQYGVTVHHRKSFAPVRQCLQALEEA